MTLPSQVLSGWMRNWNKNSISPVSAQSIYGRSAAGNDSAQSGAVRVDAELE